MAATITVKGTEIRILRQEEEDFISLTDMLKAKDGDFFISDWLRNRNTVEFLGIWETVHNPNFNCGEFAAIRSQAGLNNYKISVKEWVEKTNAIGIKATAGRYGGTYAHKDIAFEFGMWISAEFKIYLIKEFQRLKEQELKQLGWDIRRNLAKINYRIHTDAIKENLIPPELTARQINLIYASEADVLNVALFGKTAKEWRDSHPGDKGNIRDYATMSQLVCLSSLENLNALFIKEKMPQAERLRKLNQIAIQQMRQVYNTERHLLYVACTRARDQLLVSGVAPVSEFVEDLRM
jgi:superfamily I DNA/RNA helicase